MSEAEWLKVFKGGLDHLHQQRISRAEELAVTASHRQRGELARMLRHRTLLYSKFIQNYTGWWSMVVSVRAHHHLMSMDISI